MFEREVDEIKELDRLFVIARQSRQKRDWKAYDDAEASFNARSRVNTQTLHRDDSGDPRSTSCQCH